MPIDPRAPTIVFVLIALSAAPAVQGHGGQQGGAFELDGRFMTLSDRPAIPNSVDLYGSTVAWAAHTEQAIEILVTNLTSGSTRLLSSVPGLKSGLQLGSLAFDGRYVVWSDNRFGNFDVFGVDSVTGRLDRLSQSPTDEKEVDVDGGSAVWVVGGQLRVLELATGTARTLQAELGPPFEPAIHGRTVVWAQSNGTDRYVRAQFLDQPQGLTLARYPKILQYFPRVADGRAVWESHIVTEPTAERAPIVVGTVIQTADLSTGEIRNLTEPTDAAFSSIGGGRVAWFETPPDEAPHLFVTELEGGRSYFLVGPPARPLLSDTHLVLAAGGGEHEHDPEDEPVYWIEWDDLRPVAGSSTFRDYGLMVAGAVALVAAIGLWVFFRKRRAAV